MRALARRHPAAVSVAGFGTVGVALAVALIGKRGEFVAALHHAPIWILGIAVALHVFWLVARCEAWNVSIAAAGGRVSRRRLFHASSVGYLGNTFNPQFGLAVRIAALRRSAPADSPCATTLVAAELPVVLVEAALAAICSFTLVGPLGVPWWVPLLALVCMAGVIAALQRLTRHRHEGFWSGFAVLRGLEGRTRIVSLVVVAVLMQIARNWLLLNYTGVDASILDSIALLIGVAVLGFLPIGPSLGAAAAVAILGTHGVAGVAAVGALLTVTAAVAAICFAGWALADRLWRREPEPATLA